MAERDQGELRAEAVVGGYDGTADRGRLLERKAALRKQVRAGRAKLGEEERAAAGRALLAALLDLPEVGMAGTIAAYLSVGTEPQTDALVFALWKRGSYLLLPVVCADYDLDWASYEGPDSLAGAGYGLLEPTEPRRGVGAIASADLVIVPALAVDRGGNRLGKGKGCYDRALARVGPAVPTIALVYDHELLDDVPAGPGDQRVRAVALPGRGISKLG